MGHSSPTPAMRAGLSEGSLAIVNRKRSEVFKPGDLVALAGDNGTYTPTFEDLCHGGYWFEDVGIMMPLGTTKEALLRGSWILNIEIQPTCERVDVRFPGNKALDGANPEYLYWERTGGGGDILEWRPSVITNRETSKDRPKMVRVTVDVPGDLTLEGLERELRDIGARVVSVGDG